MTNDKDVSIWTWNQRHAVFMGEVRLTKWFSQTKDAQRVADGVAFILSPEGQALAAEKEGK